MTATVDCLIETEFLSPIWSLAGWTPVDKSLLFGGCRGSRSQVAHQDSAAGVWRVPRWNFEVQKRPLPRLRRMRGVFEREPRPYTSSGGAGLPTSGRAVRNRW